MTRLGSNPDVTPALPMFDLAAVTWSPENEAKWAAEQADRNRQLASLKAEAPMRSGAPQDDVDGLALFDQHRSPGLL